MKKLTAEVFGHMIDGASITATQSFTDQEDLVEAAKKYGFNAAAKLAEELERHVQGG